MRQVDVLPASASLDRAARALRSDATPVVPVMDRELIGVVTESLLAQALADGASHRDPVGPLVVGSRVEIIYQFESAASALRRFNESNTTALLVLSADQRFLGIITPADLYPKPLHVARPPMVGGMATPFGVYLTTGSLKAGVGPLALVATGAFMATVLLLGVVIGDNLAERVFQQGGHRWADLVSNYFPLVFFLVGLRISPLAGIHAAEHMTVHAIEREEPLTLDVVRRMPRVHPRCGTNLAVAGSIFLGVFSTPWVEDDSLRMLVALLAAVLLRQPLGNLMQFLFTTKPPSDRQILLGIKSGEGILSQIREHPNMPSSVAMRLWNSGLFFVILGSSTIVFIASLLGFE